MEKRGVINQVFIYIFVVIVIAFIFLFGFNMVKKLSGLNEQTVYLTFKTDFRKHVDDLYYKNVGSTLVFASNSRNKPLMLPRGVNEICFSDEKVILNSEEHSDFTVERLIVTDDFCVIIKDNRLPFKIENVVVNGETYVQIGSLE